MAARAGRLAGHTRVHEPSITEPLIVVLVDELAAITAYLTDRDLRNRAAGALSLLLSQGRAVGYTVVACLQDPRKEVIPMRGLFTQTLGLRLRDATETDMVLGPHARTVGAACELIPASLPGVGWMVPDTGGQPVRFRLGHVTDADIRTAAERFPTPVRVPVLVPEPVVEKPRPARRPVRPMSRRVRHDRGEDELSRPVLPRAARDVLATAIEPGWAMDAACASLDPELWFPDQGGAPSRVLDTCAACPVRRSCLATALVGVEDGIWGGVPFYQRTAGRVRIARGADPLTVLNGLLRAADRATVRRHRLHRSAA